MSTLDLVNDLGRWLLKLFFILHYQQPDGVEGHFLVSSQNVVTKFPADKINYFQDGDND